MLPRAWTYNWPSGLWFVLCPHEFQPWEEWLLFFVDNMAILPFSFADSVYLSTGALRDIVYVLVRYMYLREHALQGRARRKVFAGKWFLVDQRLSAIGFVVWNIKLAFSGWPLRMVRIFKRTIWFLTPLLLIAPRFLVHPLWKNIPLILRNCSSADWLSVELLRESSERWYLMVLSVKSKKVGFRMTPERRWFVIWTNLETCRLASSIIWRWLPTILPRVRCRWCRIGFMTVAVLWAWTLRWWSTISVSLVPSRSMIFLHLPTSIVNVTSKEIVRNLLPSAVYAQKCCFPMMLWCQSNIRLFRGCKDMLSVNTVYSWSHRVYLTSLSAILCAFAKV